tara:strand:- start:581 stop:805 length:225 start_codon:yes stop_codon:yes gene_type:complete
MLDRSSSAIAESIVIIALPIGVLMSKPSRSDSTATPFDVERLDRLKHVVGVLAQAVDGVDNDGANLLGHSSLAH